MSDADFRNRLFLGDCIEGMTALPNGSVDHVIADPPYSDYVHKMVPRRGSTPGWGEQKNRRASISRARDLNFTAIQPETMRCAAQHFARIAKRWVVIFTCAELIGEWRSSLEASGLEAVRVGAWIKKGAAPQFTGDRPGVGFEAIVIAHSPGRKRWNGGGRSALWSVPIVLNRGGKTPRLHTAQKPEELMEALIRDFTDPGELICDPFAGSGTTLVAAKRDGRAFVGWEQDEKWFETASARLRETVERIDLFATPGVI